jgi:cell division protease FtsH
VEVVSLLTRHRDQLDRLTQALLEAETLDEDEAYVAAGVPRERREPSLPAAVAASSDPSTI